MVCHLSFSLMLKYGNSAVQLLGWMRRIVVMSGNTKAMKMKAWSMNWRTKENRPSELLFNMFSLGGMYINFHALGSITILIVHGQWPCIRDSLFYNYVNGHPSMLSLSSTLVIYAPCRYHIISFLGFFYSYFPSTI